MEATDGQRATATVRHFRLLSAYLSTLGKVVLQASFTAFHPSDGIELHNQNKGLRIRYRLFLCRNRLIFQSLNSGGSESSKSSSRSYMLARPLAASRLLAVAKCRTMPAVKCTREMLRSPTTWHWPVGVICVPRHETYKGRLKNRR